MVTHHRIGTYLGEIRTTARATGFIIVLLRQVQQALVMVTILGGDYPGIKLPIRSILLIDELEGANDRITRMETHVRFAPIHGERPQDLGGLVKQEMGGTVAKRQRNLVCNLFIFPIVAWVSEAFI